MSLISMRNILTPLTNKVHLITMLLVMFVFAILRLQGGGISISTDFEKPRLMKRGSAGSVSTQPREKASTSVLTTTEKREKTRREVPAEGKAAAPRFPVKSIRDSDILADLLSKPAREPKQAAEQAGTGRAGSAATDKKGLEDIEKSLGLR